MAHDDMQYGGGDCGERVADWHSIDELIEDIAARALQEMIPAGAVLAQVQRALLRRALKLENGHMKRTAQRLGVSRWALRRWRDNRLPKGMGGGEQK